MHLSDWQNIYFAEPERLKLLYVAGGLFLFSLFVWFVKFFLRLKKTYGSRYPFLGIMKFWFSVTIALSLCIVAYAKPFLSEGRIVLKRGSAEVVFIVDYSSSMFLKDTGWARIDIAAKEIRKSLSGGIIKTGDRAAILTFGKIFSPTLPLTRDFGALATEADKIGRPKNLLNNDLFWGTAIATTFRRVHQILDRQDMFAELHKESKDWKPKPKQNRLVIIFSDGDFFNYGGVGDEKRLIESDKRSLEGELKELKKRNIPVYSVGIGTRAGARLIEILDDYKKGEEYNPELEEDLKGQVSRLNKSNLDYLATVTGGKSFYLEDSGSDASRFIKLSIDKHRSTFAEPVMGEKRQELWLYFLLGALTVFLAGMIITKF